MNKYTRWYNQIISNAQNRVIDGYTEKHHIQPRSIGGSDDKDNLVELTAREHFICHWLLTKIYTGEAKSKMIYALNGMKRNSKCTQRYETLITSRVYENLKKEFSIVHSATMKGRDPWNKGIPITEDQRSKNRKSALGKKHTDIAKSRISNAQIGRKRSEETKEKIRNALKGKPKGPMSDEGKRIRSESAKGKSKPEGMGKKLSETVAAQLAAGTHYTQQPKLTCPHCGVQASKARYNAFHGDKCKHHNS